MPYLGQHRAGCGVFAPGFTCCQGAEVWSGLTMTFALSFGFLVRVSNTLFFFTQIKASFGINHFQVKYFDEDNEEVRSKPRRYCLVCV